MAGALFVLPSLFILIGLSWVYLTYGNLPIVAGMLYGIKPAVTAIVIFAAYKNRFTDFKKWMVVDDFGTFIPGYFFVQSSVSFNSIVGRFSRRHRRKICAREICPGRRTYTGGCPFGSRQSLTIILHVPEHARFSWPRLVKLVIAGLLCWGGALGALCAVYGWHGPLTQMGWFFTKAALLTFGGAYAVLPYVYQGAVEHYYWLSAGQMMDGLALGETTPGPLIMVVTFVGFVAGWTLALFGSDHLFLAGAMAACVVTYFTFLPSFLFILAGGPLVESTQGNLKFTAPLTGITAAVVGVILNLAVFFAYHVFWPLGISSSFDYSAAGISVLALFCLLRFKTGIIPGHCRVRRAWFFA